MMDTALEMFYYIDDDLLVATEASTSLDVLKLRFGEEHKKLSQLHKEYKKLTSNQEKVRNINEQLKIIKSLRNQTAEIQESTLRNILTSVIKGIVLSLCAVLVIQRIKEKQIESDKAKVPDKKPVLTDEEKSKIIASTTASEQKHVKNHEDLSKELKRRSKSIKGLNDGRTASEDVRYRNPDAMYLKRDPKFTPQWDREITKIRGSADYRNMVLSKDDDNVKYNARIDHMLENIDNNDYAILSAIQAIALGSVGVKTVAELIMLLYKKENSRDYNKIKKLVLFLYDKSIKKLEKLKSELT